MKTKWAKSVYYNWYTSDPPQFVVIIASYYYMTMEIS